MLRSHHSGISIFSWLCSTMFWFEFWINCIDFLNKSCRAEKLLRNSRYFEASWKSFVEFSCQSKETGGGRFALPFSINLPLTWNWPQIGIGLRRLIHAKEKCKLCQLNIPATSTSTLSLSYDQPCPTEICHGFVSLSYSFTATNIECELWGAH